MEQIRGTGTNPRSDIYSLSATLYQLLTNVIPPETLVRAEALLDESPDPIKPVNELNEEVSQAVSDIILKGMAVSQEKRFSDAREMQKALRGAYVQNQNRDAKQIAASSPQSDNGVSGHSRQQLKTNVSHTPSIDIKPTETFTRENSICVEEMPSQPVAPVLQKKPSRIFFTMLGIGAPLVLAIAAGLGWFVLRNSEAAAEKNSLSLPETVTISPTPEQTIEPVANANINADISNENISIANTNIQAGNQTSNARTQNPINSSSKSTQPTIVKPTPRPTPRTTKSTPKPPPPSKTPKATPLPRILP
jgi:serine/threonine protein kinase